MNNNNLNEKNKRMYRWNEEENSNKYMDEIRKK